MAPARLIVLSFFVISIFPESGWGESGALKPEEPQSALAEAPDKSKAIDREDASLLQPLYPFYFAYGNREIKIQLSFKMPIVKTWPLYFGYTQQMFYVFGPNQKGFQDHTYNPELFYRYRWSQTATSQRWSKTKNWVKSIDFGAFDHNSNGVPLPAHRSYNMSYLRFNFEREGSRWLTRASAQLQYLYDFQITNTDIQNYIGPVAFNISFIQLFDSWLDKSEINLLACPGGKFAQNWAYGGYQLSWSFRPGGINLVPAFLLQYYYGYAETLLNYNQQVNAFRVGLLF